MTKVGTCKRCDLEAFDDYSKQREALFKKINALSHLISVLEITANSYYSSTDRMWGVLLGARDKLRNRVDTEKAILYKEAENLDKQYKAKQVSKYD
jgi:hypothetical protein